MKTYKTLCFENEPDWKAVPEGTVDCFNWEDENPYRPKTSFQMCFVKSKGIFVKMKTDETNIRAVCTKRDENCWEDSCMEFFIKPFSEKDEYMNFEMTPKGAYLSAVGKDRENRVFLKSITDKEPSVKTKITQDGWELELTVPNELIESVFNKAFIPSAGTCTGNFYKCGDLTEKAHFASFSPMGQLPPGFHNPELFAKFIVKDACL